MDGLVAGLYEIVPALQKVAAALTILALVVLGIGVITGGAEGRSKFKEVMKNIVIGCALVFGASSLGSILLEGVSLPCGGRRGCGPAFWLLYLRALGARR